MKEWPVYSVKLFTEKIFKSKKEKQVRKAGRQREWTNSKNGVSNQSIFYKFSSSNSAAFYHLPDFICVHPIALEADRPILDSLLQTKKMSHQLEAGGSLGKLQSSTVNLASCLHVQLCCEPADDTFMPLCLYTHNRMCVCKNKIKLVILCHSCMPLRKTEVAV